MLEVKNLNKNYVLKGQKVCANRSIFLSVQDGEIIWIKGNSGAGKSTFLNSICGIDGFDSGSVRWGGFSFAGKSKTDLSKFRLENCGIIFQFFELLKTQNALNNALLPLKISGNVSAKNGGAFQERKSFVLDLFSEFRISALIKKKPNELSGGEKQRVGIIRALANRPKYILADEITASLDSEMSRKVYSLLRSYIKSENGIGIFVSHDSLISEYVDSCYQMSGGELKKCI